MSFFFRPQRNHRSARSASKVSSPLRTCASNDAWDMYDDTDAVESPEDIRPSTIASSIIDRTDDSKPSHAMKEEEWSVGEYGECDSCDEDYVSDEEEDEGADDEDIDITTLSEQDQQRAMGMTVGQLRRILPQEEGTVWRVSGQRLEKIAPSSSPPIGVFECGEVYLCALPTHASLQLHLWIGRRAHRDKVGLGCVRAVQMRAALALVSLTGGKEVTIQQRQGQESHAFLLAFGGSIKMIARPYPRRRLLRPLPLDLNPELIVYRVMAKDFSEESLPTVEVRRLRPYTVPLEHAIPQTSPNGTDRSQNRRGSVQAAIESRLEHHQEHEEEHVAALAREEREMHEGYWGWLEALLKVNRNTNTCLVIMTLKPRRLHDILHGHKQFSVDSLMERLAKCEGALMESRVRLESLRAEQIHLASSLSCLKSGDSIDDALLSLEAAATAIAALSKQDISFVRNMKKPPKSVMLVLEVVTKVLQASNQGSKKERRQSMPSFFDIAKKTWLLGSKLEGFEQFHLPSSSPWLTDSPLQAGDERELDHALITGIIEPFLEHRSFQSHDAAKTSKVAGALCMWIRELSRYCKACLSAIDSQDQRDHLEDRQATVIEDVVPLIESIGLLEAKLMRLHRRYNLAVHLRDSLATQRHTLTLWMGSKREGPGLGGEVACTSHSEEEEVKSSNGSRFSLSRVDSLLIKLGPSVNRESKNRSRHRAGVFAASCGLSGSFSLQGTVAANGSAGGHHRLHADDELSSDDDDDDDDEDDEEGTTHQVPQNGMSITDGGFLAMEIVAKPSSEEGDEGTELICERAEECLNGSVQDLHSESAYIFISPSHNQYNFHGKGAVTDVEVFLWMGSKAPLSARLGARRSVRVLAEWSVDTLGAQVDQDLGIEPEEDEEQDGENEGDIGDGDGDGDDYGSVVSEVLSPSNLSLPDGELSPDAFPTEQDFPTHLDSGDTADEDIIQPDSDDPRMLSVKSKSSSRSLKKKASVRWKESVVDHPHHTIRRQGSSRSMNHSHKVIQAHKLEHSSSIANLLSFIESAVTAKEEVYGGGVAEGKSFNLGVSAVVEEEDGSDSEYGDAHSLRHSSLGRLSVGDSAWDESVAVCGSKASLRLHFHTLSEGKEPFDFKCYFARHVTGKISLSALRQRQTNVYGAANTPIGLSLTLRHRKELLVEERRSMWEKRNRGSMMIEERKAVTTPEGSITTQEIVERVKLDALNEARRVCLDADIRCNDEGDGEVEEEEEQAEEGHEDVTEFDETVHEVVCDDITNQEEDDEEEVEDDVAGCSKGLLADSLLGEEGSDEGLEGLCGDDGSGEVLAWRLDADGFLSPVSPEDVGMLESNFVYVFFYASMVKESSREEMRFVTYLWHGMRAPRHQKLEWEINVRPNFIADFWEPLTFPLRPKPLFIHINQGKEPAHFRRVFESGDRPPFIVYSSSLTVSAEPYFRLITFRVRELDCGFISITQVPSTVHAFLSSDVLIVIKDIGQDADDDSTGNVNELWFWVGLDSNDEAKRCAALSVSSMLEYMGLPDTLAHTAQVVSEDEVLKEVVHKSMRANEEEKGAEDEEENQAHARFGRLLKAMTPKDEGGTDIWWEKRKHDHLRQVVQGDKEWEHVSEDRLWGESCPTARLYAVTSSHHQRQFMPSAQDLDREQGTSLSEKLKNYFEGNKPKSTVKSKSKYDVHYKLKRVPFFLYSDLLCAQFGALVDSPVGIFAYEPIGLSLEASIFLRQVVAERVKERSLLAVSTLGNKAQLTSSHGRTVECPLYWLSNEEGEGMVKFQSYFQEYKGVARLHEWWVSYQAKSSSTFLLGNIASSVEKEWYHELSAYDRSCLRRGSVTMDELSEKRPTPPVLLTVETSQDGASTQSHHHRVRRNSILTSEALALLTAHPTSAHVAISGLRRQSITASRPSLTTARRFSVQQLLIDPAVPRTIKTRRSSLQALSSPNMLKTLNSRNTAESPYKTQRRASLQTPTHVPSNTSAMVRSFGFRAMSSSFSLLGSPRDSLEEEPINQTSTDTTIKVRKKSMLWSSIWG